MTALADMQASIARIDERTQLTHDLLRSHIDRSDGIHDALHHRINETAVRFDDADGALDRKIDRVASKTNWIMGAGTVAWAGAVSFLASLWDGLTG